MRFLYPLVLLLLVYLAPSEAVECLNYRVAQGQPILKAERNPRCHSKAEYCVKITGNSANGNQPFISGRCEHTGECKEYGDDCFARTDSQGKEEEVCCSSGNFSNQGSSLSVLTSVLLFISFLILAY
uniref:Activin_recp domain-containing protein n=1 Tax=Caenorhabditis tropicalis TaxID=1561998 RepID=A0A1I7U6A9_9PELO